MQSDECHPFPTLANSTLNFNQGTASFNTQNHHHCQNPSSGNATSINQSPVPRPTPRRQNGGLPHDPGGIDPPPGPGASGALLPLLLELFLPLLQQRIAHDDDPLTLVVPQGLQHLQLLVDILFRHRGEGGQLGDRGRVLRAVEGDVDGGGGWGVGSGWPAFGGETGRVAEQLDERLAPVLAVAQHAQVRQRFLRRAEFAFPFGELVAERDEEAAESLALILRQREDARDVVAFGGFFFFGEVTD